MSIFLPSSEYIFGTVVKYIVVNNCPPFASLAFGIFSCLVFVVIVMRGIVSSRVLRCVGSSPVSVCIVARCGISSGIVIGANWGSDKYNNLG